MGSVKVNIFSEGLATLMVRIQPLAKMLATYGVDCKVIAPINWSQIMKRRLGNIFSIILTHPFEEYLHTIVDPPDVIVIGKVSTPQILLFERSLKNKGVKVIFDLNDALFLRTSKFFGANIRPGSFCLEEIIKNADFVTVNGHYLMHYVKPLNEKTAIIHDPVDTELFNPKLRIKYEKLTIGWEGDPRVHYENLALLMNPLIRLAKEYDIRFKIVSYLGDLRVKRMFSKLEKLMEIDYGLKQWVLMDQFAKLLSDIDIFVAPLQKTPWYEGKSALRVGLGMAMGIPVVASPVGEQRYVIKHGINGFLARNEEEWYNYLKMLIEDEDLRKRIGKEGRKTVEKELSLEVNGRKLYEIIKTIIES